MSEELTITKERVLETAGKCPEVKETLKVLFPSAFLVCCDSFKNAIGEGDIQEHKEGSPFTFGNDWIVSFCPFCGAGKK